MTTATARVTDAGEGHSTTSSILQPGRNCWRVDRAHRYYCIQDAADYFRLVRQALLNARDTVFMLGWDIYAALDLLPGSNASDASRRDSRNCCRSSSEDDRIFAVTS